ncbi:MAG TPA: hypothetical protein VEY93_11745 [Longimicrobium sp.]|nr:hypothetical protein [Longimicrobium sp.]
MRTKLKLNLDQLAVDSFDTTKPEAKTGTVFGEQCTCYTNCTCPGCPTCYASCNGTCGNTCDASCNGTCGDTCDWTCNYTDCGCDTYQPCTTAQYTHCGQIICY